MSAPARLRIGISGWRYAPWRGDFYPEGLRQKDELRFASRAVNSIEINGTFYALQTPERFRGWAEDTPEDFVFSVKAPRYITHVRRLREIDEPLANFFASGPLALRQRLGPFLWQFPPSMRFDRELFADFLARLPRDGAAAQKLARHSAARLHREGYLDGDPAQRLRHAVEIRHESFVDPTFIELLREYRVALVVADTAGKWPLLGDVCADFLYLRLHGDKELYRSGYSEAALGPVAGTDPRLGRRRPDRRPAPGQPGRPGDGDGARPVLLLRQRRQGARTLRRPAPPAAAGTRRRPAHGARTVAR